MNDNNFISEYFSEYKLLAFNEEIYPVLKQFKELALKVKASNKKLIFAGNGASSAISAHGAVDFTKQGGIRSITFNEVDLITCFANDYGYENWIKEALNFYADEGDVVVLISVSGTSPNVVEAAKQAIQSNLQVVSFTGKSPNNPLKQLSDISFWVDSKAYNIVEGIHMIWLTTVIDMIIGNAEYTV